MMNQKIENLLQVGLEATQEELEKSAELSVGYDTQEKEWELMVKYQGSLMALKQKYPGIQVTELLNHYGILLTPSRYVNLLAEEKEIEFIEKPKRLFYELLAGKAESCMTQVQRVGSQQLHGKGVLVAVIDSGIHLEDSEFRNPNGTTRILKLWDQTSGMVYSREQINQLLLEEKENRLPAVDVSGHGTNVAAIACGNQGVADQADILFVKMAMARTDSFPRTTQLMEAVDFVLKTGMEYERPVAINISFGNHYGDHTGASLLETYLNAAADSWKCVICAGSGNEGLGANHSAGVITAYGETEVEIAIAAYETSVNIQIWKNYWDSFDVEMITPTGRNLGKIDQNRRISRFDEEETRLLTFYGEPSPYSVRQEIYIDMLPKQSYIRQGVWKLRLTAGKITEGRFDMWLPSSASMNRGTGFLQPNSHLTCTIPSTAKRVISVGAYDGRTGMPAPFSGRGDQLYHGAGVGMKPDLVAPGVDIALSRGSVSGTSFSTPFVTGAAALLMEWGIVKGNDPYLFGEKVKAYLRKGAGKMRGESDLPNERVGYGALCLRDSFPN